ncbi:hypothetical protein QBC41DRAFT_301198 [Cercophora samala]|uniref:Uncharacterized protein n=1 Tax=Cercophora samala TaxID=330535 RepID=A0AA40DBX3_9PEZI|nr:hypothetical protein QBC41DRAFT_301198 [Cercophora samala]
MSTTAGPEQGAFPRYIVEEEFLVDSGADSDGTLDFEMPAPDFSNFSDDDVVFVESSPERMSKDDDPMDDANPSGENDDEEEETWPEESLEDLVILDSKATWTSQLNRKRYSFKTIIQSLSKGNTWDILNTNHDSSAMPDITVAQVASQARQSLQFLDFMGDRTFTKNDIIIDVYGNLNIKGFGKDYKSDWRDAFSRIEHKQREAGLIEDLVCLIDGFCNLDSSPFGLGQYYLQELHGDCELYWRERCKTNPTRDLPFLGSVKRTHELCTEGLKKLDVAASVLLAFRTKVLTWSMVKPEMWTELTNLQIMQGNRSNGVLDTKEKMMKLFDQKSDALLEAVEAALLACQVNFGPITAMKKEAERVIRGWNEEWDRARMWETFGDRASLYLL